MSEVIDGKKIAKEILEQLNAEVGKLSFQPLFVDVVVGDDPVVQSYVARKAAAAEALGIKFIQPHYPSSITTEELVSKITELNALDHLAGLIVQLPLPPQVDRQKILDAISPKVDVDCLGRYNNSLFYHGGGELVPPTAGAIIHILDSLNLDLSNKKILVIGQGELVGKPVTHILKQRGLQVLTADHNVSDLSSLTKSADVIISATGHPSLLKGGMIKSGSTVIDAGTAESGGGIVGDVEFESVRSKADFVSPVPGGVGPVTVAKLLENVVKVAEIR